jgi:hypothetical protein
MNIHLMPGRLEDVIQGSIDQSWNKALTPVDKLDHQSLLDTFLLTQAYQIGVDKLSFRSEKQYAAGTVVMEIAFDRSKPEQDRFEVKIYDQNQKLVRQETYQREEIEISYRELVLEYHPLYIKGENELLTPEEKTKLVALKARHDAVEQLFPPMFKTKQE